MSYSLFLTNLFCILLIQQQVMLCSLGSVQKSELISDKKDRQVFDRFIPLKDIQKIILGYLFTWDNSISVMAAQADNSKIRSLCFSYDGKKLLSCARKDDDTNFAGSLEESIILIWDLQNLKPTAQIKGTDALHAVFSSHDEYIATDSGGWTNNKLFDGKTFKHLQDFPTESRLIAISPKNKFIAFGKSGSVSISIFFTETGKLFRVLANEPTHRHKSATAISFSNKGNKIAACLQNNEKRIWNIETGQELWKIFEDQSPANKVLFSPDGRNFISNANKKLIVRDALTFLVVHIDEDGGTVGEFAFSGDSKFLFCRRGFSFHNNSILQIIDMRTFKTIDLIGDKGNVSRATENVSGNFGDLFACSPNGVYIARPTKNHDIELLANQALEIEYADQEELDKKREKQIKIVPTAASPVKESSFCSVM